MRRWMLIILFIVLPLCGIHAEVVVLNSGKTVCGIVLLQTDEVVIVQDAKTGTRFQIAKSEVRAVKSEENNGESEKKGAMRLIVSTGGVCLEKNHWGMGVEGSLAAGTRNLANRSVFLGGKIGVNAVLFLDETKVFIPLQMIVSMPLAWSSNHKHAVEMGGAIGYGFSTHHTQGGLAASLDAGWRYQMHKNSALLLNVHVGMQQDQIVHQETIDAIEYKAAKGSCLVQSGLSLVLQF